MNLKTLTGSTIHAALQEARSLYGENVVLLESVGPQGGQPARITVFAEAAEAAAAPRRAAPASVPAPAVPAFAAAAAAENLAPRPGSRVDFSADDALALPPAARGTLPTPAPAARGRLYPARTVSTAPPSAPAPAAAAPALPLDALEKLLEAQMRAVQDKLDALERRFGQAVIGAAHTFAAHPLFAGLLEQGMRPQTATALFERLAGRGYGAATDEATLRWALAQEMRTLLESTAPRRAVGTQLFVGPSGAGKTSLILKMAQHPGFYGRRKTGVIVVVDEDDVFHQPVEVYRRFGLAVQSVSRAAEMPAALDRMRGFDQILIDTPPLPARPEKMRAALAHLKALVAPVMPLQVTLVVSAAAALEGLTPDGLERMPLVPDAVALTHLDETAGWGRVAEWLMHLARPVSCVACGPRTPHDLYSYTPTWFVEEMMQLA